MVNQLGPKRCGKSGDEADVGLLLEHACVKSSVKRMEVVETAANATVLA